MENLDLQAAKAAQAIINGTTNDNSTRQEVSNVENVVTKALGVLQENGVYAALLYLYSRSDKEKLIAEKTRENLLALTEKITSSRSPSKGAMDALKFLTDEICDNLDRLLLVKQLWEQTLIYARYGAKARGAIAKEARP